MARFGCRAGFAGLVLVSWLSGCNSNDDSGGSATSRPSAGGGAPSFATLERAVGHVLVVGESAAVPHFEREYRGLATQDEAGTDLVRCELTSSSDGFIVSIEAAEASSPTPQFAARLLAPSLSPATFDATPSAADENALRVRLGDGNAFSYYEYELDSPSDPASLCSVGLTSFDRDKVVGKVACRRLIASSTSLDATAKAGASDSGPGSASVTVDFSCPFHTLAAPGGSGGTGASGAPSGGASSVGGQAGSSTGNAGSSAVVAKSCVGVTTPCSLRDSSSCELGSGCTLDEDCTGSSSSCYGQISVYSCTAIQGCVWASSSKSCIGSAWSCSSFSGPASCAGQRGCNWHSDCTGVARLCSTLSEFTCGLEPGCRWE